MHTCTRKTRSTSYFSLSTLARFWRGVGVGRTLSVHFPVYKKSFRIFKVEEVERLDTELVLYKFYYFQFYGFRFKNPMKNIGRLWSQISFTAGTLWYTFDIALKSLFLADFNRIRNNGIRFIRPTREPIKSDYCTLASLCATSPEDGGSYDFSRRQRWWSAILCHQFKRQTW